MSESQDRTRVKQRQLAWDMVMHDHMVNPEVQRRFGLAPASKDVLDMEHADSDCRLHAVSPVYQRIWELNGTASLIGHRAMLNYLGEDPADEDDDYAAILGAMTAALTVAIVSSLLDEGLISLNTPEGKHG